MVGYPVGMRGIRPFGWFIIIFNAWWLYTIVDSVQNAANEAEAGGAVLGYLVVAGFVNVVLYVLYRITNRSRRRCPACDVVVQTGLTQCTNCGFDFKKQR